MALSYAQSSYTQLIVDVRDDVNREEELSNCQNELIQHWINRAQERITNLIQVKDEYVLGLNTDVKSYNFQDRPAVTDATNATPIVVTAAAHGLSNTNRVTIRGVGGNTNANGRFQVSSVAANTFTLNYFIDVSNAVADATTVTVTTVQEHGFSSGDTVTISGVVGMTDLNAAFIITVVDLTSFTVPLVTTQTYTSGGIGLKSVPGNAAYTAGGRFWRDDEIPTFFRDFRRGQRTWSTTYRPIIEMRDIEWVLDQEEMDTSVNKLYTDYGTPKYGAIAMANGVRYFRTYKPATYDQEVTLFGNVLILGRQYDSDALTASIILPQQYEDAIRPYVKMKIYEWLKDRTNRGDSLAEFNGAMNQLIMRQPNHVRARITYT